MKLKPNNSHTSTLHFTILIILISSCGLQNQADQLTHKIQIGDSSSSYESKTDSIFRLKFTSGVRSILEDGKGNIWFGSHQEGVCLFDGTKLTYYTVADGLSDNQIRTIYEDSNGKVWFEGGEGISSYDGKKITTSAYKSYLFKNLWQSGANDLWFKGDESIAYNRLEGGPGVYRYDGKNLNYHEFPFEPQGDASSFSVSTPFVKGKNGMYWFGTYSAVIGYDGQSFTLIDNKSLEFSEESGYLHVRSIMEDSKGNLWIGNNGIGVLLNDGDTTINFSDLHELIPDNSLRRGGYRSSPGSLEHVFSIGEDSSGNIWFGDRDTGAWRYDGKSMQNFTKKDGLTATHIWQIYRTKKDELWFAMGDGSVCRFNGESFDRIF